MLIQGKKHTYKCYNVDIGWSFMRVNVYKKIKILGFIPYWIKVYHGGSQIRREYMKDDYLKSWYEQVVRSYEWYAYDVSNQ